VIARPSSKGTALYQEGSLMEPEAVAEHVRANAGAGKL